MPYEVYKFLHILSVIMIFISTGALIIHLLNGGTKQHPAKKLLGITHGIGLLLALVAGFGLLARLGRPVHELWVLVKLLVWLALAAYPALLYRTARLARWHWIVVLLLAAVAIFMALAKPMF